MASQSDFGVPRVMEDTIAATTWSMISKAEDSSTGRNAAAALMAAGAVGTGAVGVERGAKAFASQKWLEELRRMENAKTLGSFNDRAKSQAPDFSLKPWAKAARNRYLKQAGLATAATAALAGGALGTSQLRKAASDPTASKDWEGPSGDDAGVERYSRKETWPAKGKGAKRKVRLKGSGDAVLKSPPESR